MCAALDRLRPATSAETLALQFLNDANRYESGHPEDQQAYVDARRPFARPPDGDVPEAEHEQADDFEMPDGQERSDDEPEEEQRI